MKLSEISELHLVAVVAVATAIGGVISSGAEWFLIDAGTERQTDVQLVQLAIGILSEPISPDVNDGGVTPETALRRWAVDTINAAADVQIDEYTSTLLASGRVSVASEKLKAIIRGNDAAWGQSR